jgi:hopanoid biosynthesis associated RND transporter like protein HpnN
MVRAALPVVTLAALVAGYVLYFTANHLGIYTDTNKMLSPDLPFKIIYDDYQQSFPQFIDTMVVVVTGATPELAKDGAASLAQRLEQEPDLFKTVYLPSGGSFLEKHALLYPSTDELQQLADNLATVQPFLGRLILEPNLHGLLTMLESALEAVRDGDQLDLTAMLESIDKALLASIEGRYFQLSWQELIHGNDSGMESRRQLIILQPRLDYSKLQPAEGAMQAVRHLAEELQLNSAHGLRVRITGGVALAYEELQTASRGALIAGVLSLILVGGVLLIGLGSWQLTLATALTLVTGLILTTGFAAAAVGHLNLISIAFAVLYIGLGVDYAIHFCLRYKELIQQDAAQHTIALRGAARDIGGSLLVCTATTATGFYAFVPTSFAGVSELGLIAGTGMVISLVLNLSLLPALISILPAIRPRPQHHRASQGMARLLRFPVRRARVVIGSALVLGLTATLLLPAVRFDFNPIHLRDAASESVSTFNELLETSTTSPWRITLLTDNAAQSRQMTEQLKRLNVVDDAVTLDRFIPTEQDEKLDIIQDLGLLLGPQLDMPDQPPPLDLETQIRTLQDFLSSLVRFNEMDNQLVTYTESLRADLQHFLRVLSELQPAEQSKLLAQLEQSLIGLLPQHLQSLSLALTAQQVSLHNLPAEIAARWQSGDRRYRIEVFPRKRLENNSDMKEFVTAVQTVAPDATGAAVFNIEAGKIVVEAFVQALISALVAIAILLLLLMKNKRDILLVFAPLLLAAALTGASSVLFNIPFNYANVIALPLLLGVGVDSGVHMVHRFRTAPPRNGSLLDTSTTRAVLLSALTTVCSFGNLAFSPHPGAASMGQMLTIGISFTLLCTLIVLPALLYRHTQPAQLQ